MLAQRFLISVIKKSKYSLEVFPQTTHSKVFIKEQNYTFSQNKSQNAKKKSEVIMYTPVRPLKKTLTLLYVQKDYLNKGKVQRRIPFWPYLTPFYAILVNNFLTTWGIVNTTLTAALLFAGIMIRKSPNSRRERQIIKFECNHDMSKLYMTVPYSLKSRQLSTKYSKNYEGFQQWDVFTEQDLKSKQFIPTQADKRTFNPEQLQQKKNQFDKGLLKKILKEKQLQKTINRFQLDTSKTAFKLSNNYLQIIKDFEILHPTIQIKTSEMLNVPYKYLVVRSQFLDNKIKRPYHFFIDLEANGDLRYQDYLVAMGANFRISLEDEIK